MTPEAEHAEVAVEEIRLRLPNLTLAGLRTGQSTESGAPLLMLHGWMDNAASFLPMLPHLDMFDVVALEHAGHGHSEHRPPGHWYHLMDYVADTLAAVDALGWNQFYLVGHSLGGAVATLLAAAAPERVLAMVSIEGLGPLAGAGDEVVQRLQRSWRQLRDIDPSRLRRYVSVDEALMARLTKGEIETQAARAMVERGLEACDGHWRWRSDPRLNITTPYRFDEEQIQHMVAGIQCPCLVVLSDPPTPLLSLVDFAARYKRLPHPSLLRIPGGHHLHMNHPELTAAAVRRHFEAAASGLSAT